MPYSAQQHGSVALSRSQELSSTSYRIETGLKEGIGLLVGGLVQVRAGRRDRGGIDRRHRLGG